jgi:hypothetical protein
MVGASVYKERLTNTWIPYFPPYQTVQDDFGPNQVARILQAIFGPRYAQDCVVQSVKPWTMMM